MRDDLDQGFTNYIILLNTEQPEIRLYVKSEKLISMKEIDNSTSTCKTSSNQVKYWNRDKTIDLMLAKMFHCESWLLLVITKKLISYSIIVIEVFWLLHSCVFWNIVFDKGLSNFHFLFIVVILF